MDHFNRKRIVTMLLAAILALTSLLTGCNAGRQRDNEGNKPNTVPTEVPKKESDMKNFPLFIDPNKAEYAFGEKGEGDLWNNPPVYQPYWLGNIIYQETVLCIDDGSEISGYLQYKPLKVLSVRDDTFTKEYAEGEDYTVSGNKIVLTDSSRCPFLTLENLQGKNLPEKYRGVTAIQNVDTDYVMWTDHIFYTEGSLLHGHQICVSYVYDINDVNQQDFAPYGSVCPKFLTKLKAGEDTVISITGDSVTEGCSASSKFGREPFMPQFPTLLTYALNAEYDGNTTVRNFAVGGTTSNEAVSTDVAAKLVKAGSDLVLIHFGINDSGSLSAAQLKSNIKRVINKTLASLQDCEFLFIKCFPPNPELYSDKTFRSYWKAIDELATEFDCFYTLDLYTPGQKMLETKKYLDVTGNGINHPNDFIVRFYAMNLVNLFVNYRTDDRLETLPSDDSTAAPGLETPASFEPTSTEKDKEENKMNRNETSILHDRTFSQGFVVRGLGRPIYSDPIESFPKMDMYDPMVIFDHGREGQSPVWNLCQWASRYPFHDKENTTYEIKNGEKTFNYRFTDEGNGVYKYDNQSKTVEVNTETGEIRLALKGSECYTQPNREEGQEWPHLLLEQTMNLPVPETKVSEHGSIRVKLRARLNAFADNTNGTADPALHSAIFMFYLFVANYDETTHKFSDMLWFGLPVFDNREAFVSEMSFPDVGTKDSASGKWIFNIASTNFYSEDNNFYDSNGQMIFNEWKEIDVELLPLIRRALNEAQKAGYMKNAKWDNLYINGMYMGIELPGNYDLDMSVKDVDILMGKTLIDYEEKQVQLELIETFDESVVNPWEYGECEIIDGDIVLSEENAASCVDRYGITAPMLKEVGTLTGAKYVVLSLTNKSDGDIWFCFQPDVPGHDHAYMGRMGLNLYLVGTDGTVSMINRPAAELAQNNGRYSYCIPEGFDGYLFMPSAIFCDHGKWSNSIFKNDDPLFTAVGFDVNGDEPTFFLVTVHDLYICTQELPELTPRPTDEPTEVPKTPEANEVHKSDDVAPKKKNSWVIPVITGGVLATAAGVVTMTAASKKKKKA